MIKLLPGEFMSRRFVVHPIFFSLFPVLFFYSRNGWLFSISGFFISVFIVLLFTAAIWFLTGFFLKNYKKGGIIVSLFLLLFFSYGPFYDLVSSPFVVDTVGVIRVRYILIGIAMLFLIGFYFTSCTKRNLQPLTSVLNTISFVLVLMSVVNVGMYEYRVRSITQSGSDGRGQSQTDSQERPPDIYHIIVDGYGRNDTLEKNFNYDNNEFYDFLQQKGFYVVPKATSNYAWTMLSLSSVMNMDYINYLSDIYGKDALWQDALKAFFLIEDNKVQKLLRSKGYTYVHLNSNFRLTASNKNADINYYARVLPLDFLEALYSTTALSPFPFPIKNTNINKRTNILFAFNKMREVANSDIRRPIFVFSHILAPHAPYVVDENCDLYEGDDAGAEQYLGQISCVNKLLTETINGILEKSPQPPIIIIHGDHGPVPKLLERADNSNEDTVITGRMSTFIALYLPDNGADDIYDSLSLVNMYRLLFNQYLGEQYELLPDRNYYSESNTPFNLRDVSDIVQNQ